MFKKYIQKLTPAILSILLIALVLLPIAVFAVPAVPETRSLVVEFPVDQCSVELWFHDDPTATEPQRLESGKSVEIPYGEKNVEVRVIPANGYDLQAIYQIKGEGQKELWISGAINQFNESVSLKIECTPKIFDVVFVPEKGESLVSYRFSPEIAENYTNLKFSYSGSDIVIEPVEKTSRGYTFQKWEMVYNVDGVDIPLALPVNSEGKWIIPATLTIQEQWQTDGKIYLRPVFEPNLYPVWWYDVAVDPDDSNVTTPLKETLQSLEPMGSKVDLQWQADRHPGYILNVEKSVSYPVDVDDSENGDAKVNQVYRYFDPISYNLVFEIREGVACNPEDLLPGEGETIPTAHVFSKQTQLPRAVRQGYNFGGWDVIVNGKVVESIYNLDQLFLNAGEEAYALNNADQTITLRAVWIAKKFNVEYDLGGALESENTTLPTKYTYDRELKIPVPVRTGYEFLGWEINGDTSKRVVDLTLAAESYLDTVRLRAVWAPMKFDVVLDSNGGIPEEGVTLPNKVVYDAPLDTTGITLPKRSQYTFLGFYYGDVQYIKADGTSVCEKWDLADDAGSGKIVLTAKWELLPAITVNPEDYKLNFKTEKFQFPQGSYRLVFGEDSVAFTIAADGTGSVQIPESFFGNTVELIVCTHDDTLYSDYHGTLTVPARPEAPTSENNVINQVLSTDTTIQITFKEGVDVTLYETSLYLNGDQVYPWGDAQLFEGLKEGTTYVVLVRVKATDTTPASLSTGIERDTNSNGIKEALRNELDALFLEGDGEMVQSVIDQAKEQITQLKHSPTFNEEARKIVDDAAEAVKFARRQDQNIAALREYRDKLLNTHSYSEENSALIESLFEKAEKDIQGAADDVTIRDIYETAHREMSDIKVVSLQFGDLVLVGSNGLHKDHILTLVRHQDFATRANEVVSAIFAGKVIPLNDMSEEELIKQLKNQEVMAAYTMSLSTTDYVGNFQVKLLLPEELRGVSGLRVAYFDSETGTLRVLETETDGDYLIFFADSISDFVILGDPVFNLLIPMIALGLVAICQLIAIALLLKSRKASKNAVRNYSFLMPVSLTIQFFPQVGEWVVLILGALVIVLQIILTVLLFKTDVIHKSFLKRNSNNAAMTMATPEEEPVEEPLEESFPVTEDMQTAVFFEDATEDGVYYALDDSEENPFQEQDAELYEDAAIYGESSEISAEDLFVDSATYSLDPTTGELYEDPYGEYTEDSLPAEQSETNPVVETFFAEEASSQPLFEESLEEEEDDVQIVSEDEQAPLFTFEDEDVVYGDPAEPPYEDEAIADEPEDVIIDTTDTI